jgi:hypothetical protein
VTFYLPNRAVRPVGYEIGEFIDDPILPDVVVDDDADESAAE